MEPYKAEKIDAAGTEIFCDYQNSNAPEMEAFTRPET